MTFNTKRYFNLNEKFGDINIRKLIQKSYLIKI